MNPMRRSTYLLALVTVLATATPALAQISGSSVNLARYPHGRNAVAYDGRVYLVAEILSPVNARFYNKNGQPLGANFSVASASEGFSGWPAVAAGGTAEDPVFLLTYIVAEPSGSHTKYGRIIRYKAGQAPTISARIYITNIGTEWYSAEKGQIVWAGGKFIVGTRVPATPLPQPQVNQVSVSGEVSGGSILGDYLDYYGAPSLACADNGVCAASGYANGVPMGGTGGSYMRLFNRDTLAAIGAMKYLGTKAGRKEDQGVVYQSHLGRFLAGWWRAGSYDTSLITTDGTQTAGVTDGPVTPGAAAGDAGELAWAYNAGTKSTLLVTKSWPADLYAIELGDTGAPRNLNNRLLVSPTDWGVVGTPEYVPAIAVNNTDSQWFVTAIQWQSGRGSVITGKAAETATAPSAPTLVSPAGAIQVATPTFTWNASSGATAYYLWVTDSTGQSPVKGVYTAAQAGCAAGTGVCSVSPGTALAPGAAAWWVQASNTVGESAWSSGQSFTIVVPPASATLVSPSGSATPWVPTFTWNAVPTATWYYVWVENAAGTNIVAKWVTASSVGCAAGTGQCSLAPGVTLSAGSHKWWVQTWSAAGHGPWSAPLTFSFSTPAGPSLTGISFGSSSTTYKWDASNASWYYLWVTDSSGKAKIQQWISAAQAGCSTGGICTITLGTPLNVGAGAFWVRAWSETSGYTSWSSAFTFTR